MFVDPFGCGVAAVVPHCRPHSPRIRPDSPDKACPAAMKEMVVLGRALDQALGHDGTELTVHCPTYRSAADANRLLPDGAVVEIGPTTR